MKTKHTIIISCILAVSIILSGLALADSQGKGWGKQLMNGFISACRNKKIKRIVLETDKESNLDFYEHLGFKSIGTFYSPLLKEFSGLSGDTFIYELLLE